jgi:transcription elongation GreA/GreB family factor
MKRWSKAQLRDELAARLKEQLALAERAHQGSVDGATHEEARPENEKDTRALEQSYLARGQAQRIVELKEAIAKIQAMSTLVHAVNEACSVGSVVQLVDDNDQAAVYFIAAAGGGTRLAGGAVQVVTPPSPLGRALMGCKLDDDVEITLAGRLRTLSVTALE